MAEEQIRYKRMSEEEIIRLIKARIAHENLFSKKFYRRNENWTIIRNTANLLEYSIEQLRTKWNNLIKQYKELVNPPTGVQTEDGEVTAATWEFFELMHTYGSSRHALHPPLALHSQRGRYQQNPNNSFTGANEVEASLESICPTVSSESTSLSIEAERHTEPRTSRQLARNYVREGDVTPPRHASRKRNVNEEILKKYKKECKRHKKESKCFFKFLEGFANFTGIPFERPSSDSEY